MEFTYSMDAPKGHLPLTNALRGTELFQVRTLTCFGSCSGLTSQLTSEQQLMAERQLLCS